MIFSTEMIFTGEKNARYLTVKRYRDGRYLLDYDIPLSTVRNEKEIDFWINHVGEKNWGNGECLKNLREKLNEWLSGDAKFN